MRLEKQFLMNFSV